MVHLAITTSLKAFQHYNDSSSRKKYWKYGKKIPVGITSGQFTEHSMAALIYYTTVRKYPALGIFLNKKCLVHIFLKGKDSKARR